MIDLHMIVDDDTLDIQYISTQNVSFILWSKYIIFGRFFID